MHVCARAHVSSILLLFFIILFYFSRKTTPTKELYGDSEESEMESEESEIEYSSQSEKTPPPPANTRRIISVAEEKMPSEAELEEFFEEAEKLQQKRFAEK